MIVENVTANRYATTTEFDFVEFAVRSGQGFQREDLKRAWCADDLLFLLESETDELLCSVRVPEELQGAVWRASVLYQADLLNRISVEVEDRGEDGLWLNAVYSEENPSPTR